MYYKVIQGRDRDDSPKLDIAKLCSEMRKDEEQYGLFCDMILSCIIGQMEWKKNRTTKRVSEMATVTDEAFRLLVLENSWDQWSYLLSKGRRSVNKDDTNVAMTKWMSNPCAAKKYQGWDMAGIVRFNALCANVVESRKDDGGKKFEVAFMKCMEAEQEAREGGRKQKQLESEVEPNVIVVYEDAELDEEQVEQVAEL